MTSRPHNEYWKTNLVKVKPHRGRFEALEQEAEAAFRLAAERAERVQQCLMWIDPTPWSDSCQVEAPNYEVTPGGLSYQDAALQCLLEGCHRTLEQVSNSAAIRSNGEAIAHHLRALDKAHGAVMQEQDRLYFAELERIERQEEPVFANEYGN